MTVRVIGGDCIAEMAAFASKGLLVDAIVTDPPYGLEFMGKEWDAPWQAGTGFSKPGIGDRQTPWPTFTSGNDAFGGANPTCAGCGGRARGARKCFCAQPDWRVKGVAPDQNYGRHRQMRGYQDWSFAWATAAHRVLKPGGYLLAFGGSRTHHRIWCAIEDAGFVIQDTIMWLYGQGFPKGRTQLKPAFEPICVAYKPGGKRTLQIDECRINFADGDTTASAASAGRGAGRNTGRGVAMPSSVGGIIMSPHPLGRWPANLCHDGSDEAMEAFAAFGETKSSGGKGPASKRTALNGIVYQGGFSGSGDWQNAGGLGDSGSRARFFYCAKASKADRAGSKHPTVKPVALMRWLVRLVTPPGGTVLDPFAGSGTTGAAALAEGRNAILIEREPEYIADIRRRIANTRRAVAQAA